MKSSTKWGVLGGLAVLLGAGAWFGYWQSQPVAVVAPLKRGTSMQIAPANVLVSAESRMEIKSETRGVILKSNIRRGSEVKAGEVLFEIDPRDIEIEIERIEAEYKAEKARIDVGSPVRFEIATAEETVRNYTRLVEQGTLAQVELDRAKRNVEQLNDRKAFEDIENQRKVDSLENQLKVKRRQLEKAHVLAPADGTVSEIFANTGELVGEGHLLAHIISKARVVEAQIGEEHIMGVRPGLPVNVQLLGHGGKTIKGTVDRVLPGADERTKRYIAYLELEIDDQTTLAPGLTGEATIIVGSQENALLADKRAMLGHNVFVVKDGRAILHPVTIGYSSLSTTQIMGGAEEGDEVIVTDVIAFRDGQRVRVQREKSR